jgi:hypothetical protein
VGLLDGAVLGLVASGLFVMSGRCDASGLDMDGGYARDPSKLAGIWPPRRGDRLNGASRSTRTADPRMCAPLSPGPPLFPALAPLPDAELQALLRADIQRRLDELLALSWLGRAYAAAPWLVRWVAPSAFALQQYQGEDQLCCEYRGEGGRGAVECTLRESSVVARGIPFRLRVDGSDTAGGADNIRSGAAEGSSGGAAVAWEPVTGGDVATGGSSEIASEMIPPETPFRLTGIGCDILRASRGIPGSSLLAPPAAASLAERLSSTPKARRRLASVVSGTIFQRLTPVARAVKAERRIEACGPQVGGLRNLSPAQRHPLCTSVLESQSHTYRPWGVAILSPPQPHPLRTRVLILSPVLILIALEARRPQAGDRNHPLPSFRSSKLAPSSPSSTSFQRPRSPPPCTIFHTTTVLSCSGGFRAPARLVRARGHE